MTDESALVAPPPCLLLPLGEEMSAVAAALGGRLTVADAPAAPTAAMVVLVLASPGTAFDELRTMLDSLRERDLPRRTRVWVVFEAGVGHDILEQLDTLLDSAVAPSVDSVVLVPNADSNAVAVALQAWLWLRHDAPSGAFADLRDAGGACRFAAIAAVSPSSPPSATAPSLSATAGEHALLHVGRALDASAATARAAARERATTVSSASDEPLTAASLAPQPPAVTTADADAVVAAIGKHDLPGLRAAQDACAAIVSEPDALPDGGSLSQAELGLVQADTAVHLEQARTGFTAKIGRRKRLAAAVAQRTAAAEVWAELYADRAAALGRNEMARTLASQLSGAVADADARRAAEGLEHRRRAASGWLREANATAASINPPVALEPGGLSRAWGRAAPSIRHYLLVPAGLEKVLGDSPAEEADGVAVRTATGLGSPIAAALLMGLPLRALRRAP